MRCRLNKEGLNRKQFISHFGTDRNELRTKIEERKEERENRGNEERREKQNQGEF